MGRGGEGCWGHILASPGSTFESGGWRPGCCLRNGSSLRLGAGGERSRLLNDEEGEHFKEAKVGSKARERHKPFFLKTSFLSSTFSMGKV